jgi:pilus assembly protein CpaB
VRVDDIRGVAGFILPGDRVDVVLLRTDNRQGETQNSAEVLLDFVKVLAIDQLLNERQDQPTVATVAKAVTLQVTPEQAQKVLLAGNVGKLSLVLRQPAEGRTAEARRITDSDLGPAIPRREASAVPMPMVSAPVPPKARQDNTKVSIYHGMDLKLYDVVQE